MKINIKKEKNTCVKENEINITIQYSGNDDEISKIVEYITYYENQNNQIVVIDNSELKMIDYKDIIYFYSDKKHNYCKTLNKSYKIKSKLYEVEKMNVDFIRISKYCVVNLLHLKSFDMSEPGKIVVNFDNGEQENVSRRRIKDIKQYLNERSV